MLRSRSGGEQAPYLAADSNRWFSRNFSLSLTVTPRGLGIGLPAEPKILMTVKGFTLDFGEAA